MSAWVLLVVVFNASNTGGVAITTIDFPTEQHCLAAQEKIQRMQVARAWCLNRGKP
jgi:hypothetical protein